MFGPSDADGLREKTFERTGYVVPWYMTPDAKCKFVSLDYIACSTNGEEVGLQVNKLCKSSCTGSCILAFWVVRVAEEGTAPNSLQL